MTRILSALRRFWAAYRSLCREPECCPLMMSWGGCDCHSKGNAKDGDA
jgi:hypothetical protein